MQLHPLLVHFPIALAFLMLAFDLAGLVFRKAPLAQAALYTHAFLAVGAVAAYLTGEPEEHAAERLAGVEALLERHEDLGKLLMIVAVVTLGVRLFLAFKKWLEPTGGRALMAALTLSLCLIVAATGYAGGELVYKHGAGVAPVMQQLPPSKDEH